MGTLLKILGGIMLVVLGLFLIFVIDIPIKGPLGFIIQIAMIAVGSILVIKGKE